GGPARGHGRGLRPGAVGTGAGRCWASLASGGARAVPAGAHRGRGRRRRLGRRSLPVRGRTRRAAPPSRGRPPWPGSDFGGQGRRPSSVRSTGPWGEAGPFADHGNGRLGEVGRREQGTSPRRKSVSSISPDRPAGHIASLQT